jgi:EAL domain-containing protein (putative c-di-GMP-specific phosphodiesterase class I)
VSFDADGRALGRFVNSTLTSSFQAIRALDDGRALGYEGFARSYSATDQGLSIWNLLDRTVTDLESTELDRLARMLHAINFFRQPAAQSADLFVNVHARLLATVPGNHGNTFRRILESLELPHERVVLQMPAVTQDQNWILNVVAENYCSNGFRIAVNANSVREAQILLDHVRPEAIKLDVRQIIDFPATATLLAEAAARNIQIIFKRAETASQLSALQALGGEFGHAIHVQGFLWDLPHALLSPVAKSGTLVRTTEASAQAKIAA